MTIRAMVTKGKVRDWMLSRNGIIAPRLLVLLVVSFGLVDAGPVLGQTIDPEAREALYNLDFDVAEEKFEQLTVDDPDNPTYWNLLASSIWLKIVYEQEKMNLDSFSGARIGGRDSGEVVDSGREARLREVLGRAIAAGEAAVEREPNDVDALYALGTAHGTLASFEATIKRAYLKANREAKEARNLHMRVLELDPSYADARLTIGTYDYALGVIPGFVRFLLGFIGVRGGNKEEGIEQLEYAAQLGDRASANAKMVLVVVYNREKEYEKALAYLEDLHSTYPRNFLLELAKASVYERMEEWSRSIEVYRTVVRKVVTGEDDYDRLEAESVQFKIGEASVHSSQNDQALAAFLEVVGSESSSDDLKARSFLWMGKIYDSRQERGDAIAQYNAILLLDCSDDLKRDARMFRKTPFKG